MTGLSKNPQKIKDLFNNIANDYDRNNNIISLGLHNRVKRLAIKELSYKPNMNIADICCGTGDITNLLKTFFNPKTLTGIDFSEEMLKVAKNRFPSLNFIKGDATMLPLEDNSLDIITMTFGLRNIENRKAAIKEAYRTLKKDGEFLHLDFGNKGFFSSIFDILVKIGISLFYGNKLPYNYLLKSKQSFPKPEELIEEFLAEGFSIRKNKTFLFGIIGLQIFYK